MNSLKSCRSCYSTKLTNIISLGEQYLSDFSNPGESMPDKYPLELVLCENCTLLQLKHTTPPEKMYNDRYGFKSGVNDTIKADLKDIVKEAIKRVGLKGLDVVLDIGCNDLSLLKNYPLNVIRIGFDPVKKFKN